MKVGATQKEEFGPKTKISYPEKPFQENSAFVLLPFLKRFYLTKAFTKV